MAGKKRKRLPNELAVDSASVAMLEKADADGVARDAFSRADAQGKACKVGLEGVCCRICHMGPCTISETRPGVCGATADTVAARNLLREVAAGTAAHAGHGRNLTLLLKAVGEGRGGNYRIRDEARLRTTARTWGVDETGRDAHEVAREVADLFLREFTLQEGKLESLALAPEPRQGVWDRLDIAPAGIDSTVVEALHRTNMGTDHDYKNLVKGALKTAIADGWAGSMITTTVSDILFGTPKPIRARANLGVLEEKQVNVLVHGHEPALTEILVTAS
jgi:carbon-monoxide dehydrogenase catalytic subunit